ncbi:MAG: glycosyltransferase [Hydrogenophaga sp.]|nr:glycosyltransferase [Hydrogenophaga sp.]
MLYDHLEVYGGAERVLVTLQQHWGSDVCVSFHRQHSFGDQIPPERLIDLGADHPWQALRLARVLYGFSQQGEKVARTYPVRVYAGSYSVLAHRPNHEGRAIYYCHTPPRFLYDLRDYYAQRLPLSQRPLLAALRAWLQPRYEVAVKSMHTVLANSRNVQQRLKTFLNIDAQVVYPPVDTDRFKWISDGDYFLSTSRLEPLKRVDVLIDAFKAMPHQKLVVASGGSEFERLKRLAAGAPNIHFTGWTTDDQLRQLIGECRATLYVPKDEDFGMSPVESMAAGKPVVSVAEGGILETVIPGETGLLVEQLTPKSICAAVEIMSTIYSQKLRAACENRAKIFSSTRFLASVDEAVSEPRLLAYHPF